MSGSNAPQAAHRAWDEFVARHPDGHLLQTSTWGQVKAEFEWNWEIIQAGGGAEGGALILYRRLPLNLVTIAYVPRGPVIDWNNAALVTDMFTRMQAAAKRRRALALWVEPELLDSPQARAQLLSLGFKSVARAIQPPRTIMVDLQPKEDEILARMKQKTRYNIRLALRKGVSVRRGTEKDIGIFHELMQETSDRDAFGVHSAAYYRRVFESFAAQGQVALFFAQVEEKPVAALMAFALGRTGWYFYGASSNRHRNLMTTYVLQWEAMLWAKAHGCARYDLWGIPDVDETELEAAFAERSDGLWGVYRFKRGFGGEVIRYTGLWEKSLSPLYPLAKQLQRIGR
ncbi:MAG: peptidoglycan bridge formation glycyltransferase FemA/FemB family protein [Anaerolineae bacterium]|nr:peptidoglycan bridge formation glycyltransferase FemA/FemB family protein [Anaerolineae bacterium]